MKRIENDKGFIIFEIDAYETMKFGGCGICDDCNSLTDSGYLIPVLNHYYCKSCYEEWYKDATNHKEDRWFEELTAKYYIKKVGLENE